MDREDARDVLSFAVIGAIMVVAQIIYSQL